MFVINAIYYAMAIAVFVSIFVYYWTDMGGPTLLAMTLIPIIFALFTLQALRDNDFYPTLPAGMNYAIAFAYCAFSFYCAYYMNTEYMALGLERIGSWNTMDMTMGGVMTLLIMEYARKRHMPLFILNIVLILYAVYGNYVPGMFYHAGMTWERVITASSVEIATGIFSSLPQIALTIVGSFLLVLSLLRGFGCIQSLLRATKRVAFRSPHAIPQSAVVGSMCVGMVSGSGAANAITIGSATIPAMISSGIPPATAAAIEIRFLARWPVDAAGDGDCRLPDGRIPWRRLFRGGGARLGAGPDLLRDGRDFGLFGGYPIPRPHRHR